MNKTILIILLALFFMVMVPSTMGSDPIEAGWTHTQIYSSPNDFCPASVAITTDGNGTIGGIFRECGQVVGFDGDRGTFLIDGYKDGTVFTYNLHNGTYNVVDEGEYFTQDTVIANVQVRYAPDQDSFYSCTSGWPMKTMVHIWTPEGNLITPSGGKQVFAESTEEDLSKAHGGQCSIASVPIAGDEYNLIMRGNKWTWILGHTENNFEDTNFTLAQGENGVAWPGPGNPTQTPGTLRSHNPLVRSFIPPSAPERDLQFVSWWPEADSITGSFCNKWHDFPCWTNPGSGFQLVEDIGYRTYRTPQVSTWVTTFGGVDFMQEGRGPNDRVWSSLIFPLTVQTGDQENPQDVVWVMCIDALHWGSSQMDNNCFNQHDEVAVTEGMIGSSVLPTLVGFTLEDMINTDGRIAWRSPCLWADRNVVFSTFSVKDTLSDIKRIALVGSTDNGETWAGMRPAVTDQIHPDSKVMKPMMGNCAIFDGSTGEIVIAYIVTDGPDSGVWLARNSVSNALPAFRELNWEGLIGADRLARAGDGTTILSIPLQPWADSWGVPLIVVQSFILLFSILAFAAIGVVAFQDRLIGGILGGGVGLVIGIFFGLMHYYLLFFLALGAGAILILHRRFIQKEGGVEG
jgi:hypothetical protein